MPSWWKKLTGAQPAIPEQSQALLAADLGRLEALGRGLGDRALSYALSGSDAGVVLELAATTGAGRALQLKVLVPVTHGKPTARELFFERLPRQEPAFYLRLARLYEAASRREPRATHLQVAPVGLAWLELFLWEASDLRPNTWNAKATAFVDFDLVESMLVLAGADPDALLRVVFLSQPSFGLRHIVDLACGMQGFAESVARHPGAVRESLAQQDGKCKVHALELLGRSKVDLRPHVPQLVDLGLSSGKGVRASAQALLRTAPDAAAPLLREKLVDGTAEARGYAADLLWSLDPVGARSFLKERLSTETASRVRKIIEGLLRGPSGALDARGDRGPSASATPGDPPALALAPLPVPVPGALPRSVRDALTQLARDWERKAVATFQRLRAQNPKWTMPDPPAVTPQALDQIFDWMQAPVTRPGDPEVFWAPSSDWRWRLEEVDASRFLEQPELDLVHVVRFLAAIGLVKTSGRSFVSAYFMDRPLRRFCSSRGPERGLGEVAAAFRVRGLDSGLIGWSRLEGYGPTFAWDPQASWPYYVEHLEILEEALELRPCRDEKDLTWLRPKRKSNALAVLEAFPRVPKSLHAKLWEIALGSAKGDRAAAQRCLVNEPGTLSRVVEALDDGRQEVRCLAAAWLSELKHRDAIPALETAFRKEKHDAAKAALLDAIEALGAPVDAFLNRPALGADAEKGLRKGIPAALGWFAFDRLPVVHWADTGEAIPREVLSWLVVQSHKLGSPEAGALLRRYAQLMHKAEREALGRFVLEAWIAEDTELPTPQELQSKAQQMAQQVLRYYKSKTLQELTEEMARGLANQPKGSAAAHKGVLAMAGACAGAAAAPLVQQYLKTWYGYRAAQCRALLQMLSWVDHPTAIQLVLGTATRFRTAGIRKEAEALGQLIAERKGWSLAELADRTIPTAGFDEKGELELDYGGRRFVARIADDWSVTLSNAEGKPIAALPEPKADESAELAAAAKQALGNAKKELKAALKLQRERLYEAMCTERAWSFADWHTYLYEHPIVGRYCRQLVWVAGLGPERLGTFRPMGDGSLTNARDEPVELPPRAVIQIAHACNTPEEEGRAWQEHLAAYELEPLFEQLGRSVYRIPAEDARRTRVEDYQGHLVEAFKLRGRATKLGYVRGQSEDGGWFYTYRKHFTTLGLEAVLEFSGNSLPEENRTVALRGLYFTSGRDASSPFGAENESPLGEVPAVLFSECWNDLRAIAAEGSGFDADWEKKVEL